MERRKKPRVGDVVKIAAQAWATGLVVKCEGIHLYVRLLRGSHSSHELYVRRDSVEILSYARPQ